jgi:hypothetical protein
MVEVTLNEPEKVAYAPVETDAEGDFVVGGLRKTGL